MLLEKFTLPKTDIRLITIDNTIYKIKLHLVKQPNRDETSYKEFCSNCKNQDEIEKIIIVLLTCKDDPQPINCNSLTVYPYRKKWQIGDKLQFYRNKSLLETCPYVYNFYIEPRQEISSENVAETNDQTQHPHKTMNHDGIPVIDNTKPASNHSQTNHHHKTMDQCRRDGIPVRNNTKPASHHSQTTLHHETMDQCRSYGTPVKNNTKQASSHSQTKHHHKTTNQYRSDSNTVKNNTKQASNHNQSKHHDKTVSQSRGDFIPVTIPNNTKQPSQQNRTGQLRSKPQDLARALEVKPISQVKVIEKAQTQEKPNFPKETRNTEEEKTCTQSVYILKSPDVPNLSPQEESDESKNDDNQSMSIPDGMRPCSVSGTRTSPENPLSPEILYISDSEDESVATSLSSTKVDLPEKMKPPHKPIKVIPASAIVQTRKRHSEVLDEAEPKAKSRNYSVTEYLDANRHDVQEQDLQEHLRFQELATPADEKPAIEERRSSFQLVISSVKKLMFG